MTKLVADILKALEKKNPALSMVSDRRVGTLYREVGSMKRFITMTAVELRIYQAHVLRGCWQSDQKCPRLQLPSSLPMLSLSGSRK